MVMGISELQKLTPNNDNNNKHANHNDRGFITKPQGQIHESLFSLLRAICSTFYCIKPSLFLSSGYEPTIQSLHIDKALIGRGCTFLYHLNQLFLDWRYI